MEHLRRLVSELSTAGYQLDRSAYDYLRTMDEDKASNFEKTILLALGEKTAKASILTKQQLLEIAKPAISEPAHTQAPVSQTIPAKQIAARCQVLKDPSKEMGTGGSIDDFSHYFRDRFRKLSAAFMVRSDSRDATSLGVALSQSQNQKVKFIAMVMEKRERQRRLFLALDDLEDTATILVSPEERSAYEVAQKLPLDQVVCVRGVRAKGDLFVAKEILLPDIPDHKAHLSDEEVWAVLLSDIHAGSKKFLSKELNRVFDWLNLQIGTPNQRSVAERVKYFVICGDIVDGIGIYPRQEHELAITDLYEQYEEAAKYIERIPDYIEVVVIPGNHDPVRQALPQPPIPRDFGESLYESRGIISLGNPSEVAFHGVNFLLHHGRSLDDILSSAPNMDFTQPEKGMRLQLQCRHLASEYGNRTAIAPERTDHLVIERVPDVFQSGHIHVVKYENYRGTQVINSGAWQAQTDYQRRIGLVPTPGILTAVNLQTLQIRLINFMEPNQTSS